MYFYTKQNIPIVYIANIAETVFDFVSRANEEEHRSRLVEEMKSLGDRALLYPTVSKLVIVSSPIPHAKFLIERLGYQSTNYIYPENSSPFLCLDIFNDIKLLNEIVSYAGEERLVQLVPYAATCFFLQLVERLQTEYELNVVLPETSAIECQWLREYIDTKSGFRALAAQWLPSADQIIPQGIVCKTVEQAAQVAYWFMTNDQPCIVKADRGNDALGQTVLHPEQFASIEQILLSLKLNSFLANDLLIVEQYIRSPQRTFPSVEFIVPSLSIGRPVVTYVCNQLFLKAGTFSGVLLSQELQNCQWYTPLIENGMIVAEQLQQMGYVGHFDLDAVVDASGQLFLIEVNARRTGGTHIHELACFLLGSDYLKDAVLLSNTAVESGTISEFHQLVEAIENLLYPIQNQKRGIIITHSSALSKYRFGCIILDSSVEAVLELQQKMKQAILLV